MATWKKVLTSDHSDSHPVPTNRDTRNQVAGTYNTVIGTDTDIDCGPAEHIDQINVTDGVITSMSKQTLTASELGAWVSTGTTDDSEFMVTDDINTKEFATKSAAEVRTMLNVANGATANTGDITAVTAGTGMSGGGTSGDVTLNCTITNNNQLTNGAGYTTNSGDITGVTAGTGLSGGGSSGGVTLALDFSELTDMTGGISGTTEFIVQDGTTESRKAASEIALSNFSNDSGWTSNSGDITGVTAGTGLSGGGSSGSVTLNVSGVTVSELAGSAIQLSSESFADNDTSLMTSAAIQDKITSYGYTSNSGDITGVTAGTGLTGGGSSGGVTLAVNTGAVANNAVTIPTGDHVYDWVTAQGYTSNSGDITGVTAGTGLNGGGSSGGVTLNVDATQNGITTIGPASGVLTVDDDLTVQGDLIVSGATTTVNTETVTINDNIMVLNNNASGTPSEDAGIEIERGSSTNVKMYWNEAKNQWFGENETGNGQIMMANRKQGAPTSSDDGAGVGQFLYDTSNQAFYIRTA